MIIRITFRDTKNGGTLTRLFEDDLSIKRPWKKGYLIFCNFNPALKPIKAEKATFEEIPLANL